MPQSPFASTMPLFVSLFYSRMQHASLSEHQISCQIILFLHHTRAQADPAPTAAPILQFQMHPIDAGKNSIPQNSERTGEVGGRRTHNTPASHYDLIIFQKKLTRGGKNVFGAHQK